MRFLKQVTKEKSLHKISVLLRVAEILLTIYSPKRLFYSKRLHKFSVDGIMKTILSP